VIDDCATRWLLWAEKKNVIESVGFMSERTDTSSLDRLSEASRSSARLVIEEEGRPPRTALVVPGMPVRIGRASDLEVSLEDPRVSRVHAIFRYDGRTASLQDLDSSNGTWMGDQRVTGPKLIQGGASFRVGSTSIVALLPDIFPGLGRSVPMQSVSDPFPIVASDPISEAHFALLKKLGLSELSVLLQGETGSGKEVAARMLHQNSPRAQGPFMALNCATLSDSISEAELFGNEKSSTSAASVRKAGVFEAADGGTLLLDEVSELSATNQARLLRVLQERSLTRVGGSRAIPVNVRVIAATQRDLSKEVAVGRFREDLFFRINGVTVEVPPLRSRPKDIAVLAQQVLDAQGGVVMGNGVAAVLTAHRWSGNVRELRNAMECALALATEGVIRIEHLPTSVRGETPPSETQKSALRDRVDETERKVIVTALESTGWNQSRAARVLGISRRALIYKMERYGLKPLPNGQRNA
jgi:two-component system, NtrC family, response regulator AtoC